MKVSCFLFAFLFLCVNIVFCQITIQQTVDEAVMSNGTLTLKLNFHAGGAFSYIGLNNTHENLVNTYDRGRFIQQSYYAGDILNRQAAGQSPAWSPWPWNPIQSGDVYGNAPVFLDKGIISGNTFYVKTNGLLWDMNNEKPQATFEQWISFEDSFTIKVSNKFICFRTDSIWKNVYVRDQELPAVYTIGRLNQLINYSDSFPWTCGKLSMRATKQPPWDYWVATEKWAAFVDDTYFGLGVYHPTCELFIGGFSGNLDCHGNTASACTGYLAPLKRVQLDRFDTLEYTYYLSVGNIYSIRNSFKKIAQADSTSCTDFLPSGFTIYPNPFTDHLTIDIPFSNEMKASIVNVLGEIVITQTINSHQDTINTSRLAKGTYMVILTDVNGKRFGIKKIIKA